MAMVKRRHYDIVITSLLSLSNMYGYWFMVTKVLQPRSDPVVEFLYLFCHAFYLLVVLTWVGVIYHGPGRVEDRDHGSQLPEVLAKAMDAGIAHPDYKFSGKDGLCEKCNFWKPVMASHCHQCGTCTLWMDHHCNFCFTCVGFKNLRGFLMLLIYLETLPVICMIPLLRAVYMDPYSFFSLGSLPFIALFVALMFCYYSLANHHFRKLFQKFKRGWPTLVLTAKFEGLAKYAAGLLQAISELKGLPPDDPTLLKMVQALQDIQKPKAEGGGLRGILDTNLHWTENFVVIFGEPIGWRWFLPLRAGGTGDPLSPQFFNQQACEAWARLPEAIMEGEKLMLHCHKITTMRLKQKQTEKDAYDAQVAGWVAEAEKKVAMESP